MASRFLRPPGACQRRHPDRWQEPAITGDFVHNPIQAADPVFAPISTPDQKQALATRQTFLDDYCDRDVLVFGTHFPTPAVGRIVADGRGWLSRPKDANSR